MPRIINNRLIHAEDKAGVIMLSLFGDAQKAVFQEMKSHELAAITPLMSRLGTLNPEIVRNVSMDFLHLMHQGGSVSGSFDGTRRLLESALGRDRVAHIFKGGEAEEESIWEQLSSVNEEMLANFLKKEDIQTTAVILSRIASTRSARILNAFDDGASLDIIYRMLKASPIKPAVLREIQKFIKDEFMEEFQRASISAYDPHRVVAEILNSFDQAAADRIIDMLTQRLPQSAARVRALMFTFEDLLRVDVGDMQKVISAIDKSELAVALKKSSPAIKKHFINNMSERASKLLKDDIDSLGAVRMSAIEKAQRGIISTVKQMQKDGDIVMSEAGAEDALVS